MSTLTDRYVAAALRGVPEKQRDDVERELRASVADAVDGLVENGIEQPLAERHVLTDLGDPDRLAADYSDRPHHLIGPALYFDYVRLLKVLLAVVLPIVAIAVTLAQTLAGSDIGGVVASAVTTGLTTGVHIAFWVTLIFVIVERTGPDTRRSLGTWNLDRLPELPARRQSFVETVASVSWISILVALVFVQHYFVFVDGRNVPVFNPDLWSFWLPAVVLLLVGEIAVEVVRYRTGGWTFPLAIVSSVLNIAVAAILVGLLQAGTLLNDAFFAALGWPTTGGAIEGIVVAGTVALIVVAGFSVVDSLVRAYRSR
jgi:hypothetical protein